MSDDLSTFVRTSWVNVLGNVTKIVVEGAIGLTFGSLALVADAAHSLADLLASLVVLTWGRLSFHGPDRSHPHGHERVEPLTALFVGVLLIVLAVKILYDSGIAFVEGPQVRFSYVLVVGLGFAIVDRVFVFWYTKRQNESIGSPSLHALARDSLNDVYTSFAALVGVFGVGLGYPILDPIAGGLVSILVFKEGIDIAKENVDYLVGSAPPSTEIDRIREAALEHPSVEGVHDLRCHYVGPVVEAELHVDVPDDFTVKEAHDLETDVRNRILDLGFVGDVHVHLDPAGVDD